MKVLRSTIPLLLVTVLIGCSKSSPTSHKEDENGTTENGTIGERSTQSALIEPSEGGNISVINYRGDEVTLKLPPYTLKEATTVTLTTLGKPPENPIAKNIFPGVIIEPEGLLLDNAAKLIVTFHDPPENPERCAIFWVKEPDWVLPIGYHEYTPYSIEGEIYHFSSYAGGEPTAEEAIDQGDKQMNSGEIGYGWQNTRAAVGAFLYWVQSLQLAGKYEEAEKFLNAANKIAEDCVKRFLDEEIPPEEGPCGNYLRALARYWVMLDLLGIYGETYNRIHKKFIEVLDQCRYRAKLKMYYNQTMSEKDLSDYMEYGGDIILYLPWLELGVEEEFGVVRGSGSLVLCGQGSSDDTTWLTSGSIDVEVSGQLIMNENEYGLYSLDLDLTLTMTWNSSKTITHKVTVCDERGCEYGHHEEYKTETQPYIVGTTETKVKIACKKTATIEQENTYGNTETYLKYTLEILHFK